MRSVVLISPHFPPSTLAGVHRARHMAKHLPAFGWRPIVIRAASETYSELNDPALAALVPASVEQVETRALPLGVMRRLGIGDIGIRAYPYLAAALERVIVNEHPAAVFITGFPFYPMLLAKRVRQRHGLPVVLDFQDPWVSAYGATRHGKEGLAHRLATVLEPRVLRHASFVTSVSDRQNEEMAQRYPWLDRGRMAAIPIGGDPEDFARLADAPSASAGRLDPDYVNLCYVGTFLPRAGPLMRQLFRAVARLRTQHPALAERLRLVFVGTSNQPDGKGGARVAAIAAEEGVADLVDETPARAPYLDALAILAKASALLLIGSDEPHYTASKIYPGMMSGRPFLSLFHQESSAHQILAGAGGGIALSFENAAELDALAPRINEALVRLLSAPESLGRVDPNAYAPYTARAVSGRFAAIFDQAAGQETRR